MLAWTTAPGAYGEFGLREVSELIPQRDEMLVQVEAFAPNPGDIVALSHMPAGSIPGWDGSGVVLAAAADGRGPNKGDRVIFLSLAVAGWAQRRAVPHSMTATAAADISFERLATLPVPAASAMVALRRLGSVLGRRILIVGATSAVGRIAVQLAARSGACVVAVARDANQHANIRGLGAHETHSTLNSVATRVYGAIDMIGGQNLVDAYALLEPGGVVIALGHPAGADELFPYGAFVADPTTARRSITSFFLGAEPNLADEFRYLAADRALNVGAIDVRPWTQLAAWIEAGSPRQSRRVVFRVDHTRN